MFFIFGLSFAARAVPETGIPQIGAHERLFLFKKNENPQNLMVIYTKLDRDCRFEIVDHQPVFDFYWLMDGRDYKRVHPLIKSGIRDRLEFDLATGSDEGQRSTFAVKINDLGKMKHDLEDPRVTVRAEKRDGRCVADARVTLGPSDGRAVLTLETLETVTEKTFLPPFRRLISVTLTGTDAEGRAITRTYPSAR